MDSKGKCLGQIFGDIFIPASQLSSQLFPVDRGCLKQHELFHEMKPIPEIQVDKQKTSYQKQQENPYRPVENKLFFHLRPILG